MQDIVVKARNYAFRLFKFRSRSEKEIFWRLERRKFSQSVIEKVIGDFKEQGLIDDAKFVQDWVQARRKKGLGWKRIRFELKQKGIKEESLEENTSAEKDEYKFALEIAKEQKDSIMKKGVDINKAKQRLFNFLLRRGFQADTSREVIQELL